MSSPYNGSKNITVNVDNSIIEKSICEKLLDVNVDYELTFNEQLDRILKRSGRKVNNLSRILSCKKFEERIISINSFSTSRFNYCPLVWMFYRPTMDNKINHLHKGCLRIVSPFENLLETDRSVPIQIRNLQILAAKFLEKS